jgi:hypothetical protein
MRNFERQMRDFADQLKIGTMVLVRDFYTKEEALAMVVFKELDNENNRWFTFEYVSGPKDGKRFELMEFEIGHLLIIPKEFE